ncbi:hypothetical protein C8R47DRAFT_1226461 [Mycena vitilis]|nr:hypothetical protein C8R47DRAFT_1226461 [Mycena vitilis]
MGNNPKTAKHAKAQKEPPQCSFCGEPVTANLQHGRVCNAYRKARQEAYNHVVEQKRRRDSSRDRRENHNCGTPELPDVSPMEEDDIAQLPNQELFAMMDADIDNTVADAIPTVELPPRFIFVKHHPHANKTNEIIPLDAPTDTTPVPAPGSATPASMPAGRPWAPFRTYADFKFASRRVKRRSPNAEIDEDLSDLRDGTLATDSNITFCTHRDMEKTLTAARFGNVPFQSKTLTITAVSENHGTA